jgi:superoxide dismutase
MTLSIGLADVLPNVNVYSHLRILMVLDGWEHAYLDYKNVLAVIGSFVHALLTALPV